MYDCVDIDLKEGECESCVAAIKLRLSFSSSNLELLTINELRHYNFNIKIGQQVSDGGSLLFDTKSRIYFKPNI